MTLTVTSKTVAGTAGSSVDLDAGIFGVQPNVPLMHQVVTAQLAARRAGTQSTKTRAEVSGGGKKPFKQKGTGNARQGSTRAPHYSGGGVALAPKPRNYAQKTPRKMIRGALYSALSDRAANEQIIVVDSWDFDAPKTSAAAKALDALSLTDASVLVVVGPEDENAILSFRNIPHVQLIEIAELNAYDVLCNDWIVFTRDNLPGSAKAETAAPAAKPAKAAKAAPVVEDEPAVEDEIEPVAEADATTEAEEAE
jgi:large subunit ribosomal protein L4